MKVIVNIDPKNGDSNYKQYIGWLLGTRGYEAFVTAKSLDLHQLYEMCKVTGAKGVLTCNVNTLRQIAPEVPYTGKNNPVTLDNFRGSRYMVSPTIPCIIINPMWHVAKVPHGRFLLECDIDKLAFGGWSGPKIEGEFVGSIGRLAMVLEEIKNSVICSVDIETNGEDVDKYYSRKIGKEERANGVVEVKPVFITSIGYTILRKDGSIFSYVIPFVDYGKEYWGELEFGAVLGFLRKSVCTGVPLVMQNGIYDILHLINYRAFPTNYMFDTMAMQHAQYAELPKSLDFLASMYCPDYQQWKFESKMASFDKSIETLCLYNMKDTYWTLRVCLHWMMNTPSWAVDNYVKTMKLIPSCTYAHFEGMDIDNKARLTELAKREAIFEEAGTSLRIMVGDPNFNPGSWQQLEQLFYKILWAKKPNIGKSKSCTDEKNLEAVAEQHPLFARLVAKIRDYKEQQKAIGTYFKFLQRKGKLMYQLSPWGTETGRLASQASSFNCGTQVQNIPYYAKTQFVPKDGWVWINADYSKVEAVLTAYMAMATKLIKAVTDPEKDFYKTLGTLFFEIPYEEVTAEFRNKVLKKIVHGSNYMMQGRTFIENAKAENLFAGAQELGITITPTYIKGVEKAMTMLEFANMLLEKYHEPFPEVRRFYAATKEKLLSTAKLTSPCGWTRLFFGDAGKDHSVLRTAVAHQPQGLGAEYMKKAAADIFDQGIAHPDWLGDARYKAQVHDSWVGVVRIERLQEFLLLLRRCMMHRIVVNGYEVIVPIDIEISTKSYGAMVELEYDEALGEYILPDVF